MGTNKVALIQSYCNTSDKIKALQATINELKQFDVDTCLFSAVELPTEITNQVKYYLKSDENPVLHYPEKAFNFWLWHFYKANPDRKFYMNKMFSDYGWTVLNQVQRMSELVKNFDYEWFYLVNYDLEFDDTHVIINGHGGRSQIKYIYNAASLIYDEKNQDWLDKYRPRRIENEVDKL